MFESFSQFLRMRNIPRRPSSPSNWHLFMASPTAEPFQSHFGSFGKETSLSNKEAGISYKAGHKETPNFTNSGESVLFNPWSEDFSGNFSALTLHWLEKGKLYPLCGYKRESISYFFSSCPTLLLKEYSPLKAFLQHHQNVFWRYLREYNKYMKEHYQEISLQKSVFPGWNGCFSYLGINLAKSEDVESEKGGRIN